MPSEDEKPRPQAPPSRRRVDEVFGDVLPETTSDERAPEPHTPDPDSWYLENRPPHHDR